MGSMGALSADAAPVGKKAWERVVPTMPGWSGQSNLVPDVPQKYVRILKVYLQMLDVYNWRACGAAHRSSTLAMADGFSKSAAGCTMPFAFLRRHLRPGRLRDDP